MKVIKFGGTDLEQTNLALLTKKGLKTATSSLVRLNESETKIGDIWNICNGLDETVCHVVVTNVLVEPMANITEAFAIAEGDGSYQNWIAIHETYYNHRLKEVGETLTGDTLLECVYFEVIPENEKPDVRTFIGEAKFDVRAAGILIDNEQLLVSKESDGTFTLPGGATKVGETTKEAVVREFFEETGLEVEVDRLQGVIENFFEFEGHPYQQLIFVYRVCLRNKQLRTTIQKEEVYSRWVDLASDYQLTPQVHHQLIQEESKRVQHIINQEARF